MSALTDIPTFDSLVASRTLVFTSMDMLRIRWRPFGSIESSVYVADDLSAKSGSLSPYQQPTASVACFHQISMSPATEPPVSDITVQLMELGDWESDWVDGHEPHAQQDSAQAQWSTEPRRKLLRCCGQDRPHPPLPCTVRPTVQQFVTVHDFITQIHAWLQPLRENILDAIEVTFGGRSSEQELYVALIALDKLMIIRDERPGQVDRHWERVADHARKRVEGTVRC
jgi:hypothetical protein